MNENLFRLGIKIFSATAPQLPLTVFIPIFHRWIRDRVLDGPLLDVADYSHVHHGPGILLAAHDANYCLDMSEGRFGVMWYNKRPTGETPAALATRGLRRAATVCARLEEEPELGGSVRFVTSPIQVFSNDRLAAPNSPAGWAAFEPVVAAVSTATGSPTTRVEREQDARERLSVMVHTDGAAAVRQLAGP